MGLGTAKGELRQQVSANVPSVPTFPHFYSLCIVHQYTNTLITRNSRNTRNK